jgi:hypothetical protein
VLRYLRVTVGYGLRHASSVDMGLQGYANSDWAGSAVDRKSPQGAASILDLRWFRGVAGNKLLWL